MSTSCTTNSTSTSQRSLFAAAAPAALVPAGAASATAAAQAAGTLVEPPDPDAALHAQCAEFHRLHALGYDENNPAWEAAMDARYEAYTTLEDMAPTTEAGHRAKARVALILLNENRCHGEFVGDPDARFALVMLREWLG